MIIEHLVYSIAIAIIFGMIYRRFTGRESSWIIVLSAYTPDVDIIADAILRKIGAETYNVAFVTFKYFCCVL